MTIEALGFYVLVEAEEVKEVTAGGVYLPQKVVDMEQRAVVRGTIRGVGPGSVNVLPEHIGRTALFSRYAGLMIEDGKFRLIDSQEIRGIVSDGE